MDTFQTTTLPKPAVGALTFDTSIAMPKGPHGTAAHCGMLSKFIQKQTHGTGNHQARQIQWQVSRAVFDLKARSDRVIEENRRMAQTLADLQQGQEYLVEQLALHQKREELAIMREQQDGKRIRELENRLSLLLLAPLPDQPITITAAEPRRFAICQAQRSEQAGKEPEGRVPTPPSGESGTVPEDAVGKAGRDASQVLSESDGHCVASLPGAVADEAASTEEFDALGEVPSLDIHPVDGVTAPGGRDLPHEPENQAPPAAAVAAGDDTESDIIDLLNEVVAATAAQDGMPADTPAGDATEVAGQDAEIIDREETVESSSLNTNYVLETPRGPLMATDTPELAAAEVPAEPDVILTLLDEIPCDRPGGKRPPTDAPEKRAWVTPGGGPPPPGAEESAAGKGGGVATDPSVLAGAEDCLENIADADTNTFEVIELTEEAIIGQLPDQVPLPECGSASGQAPVPMQEAGGTGPEDTGGPSPRPEGKTARAKVLFGRGKLACQRKDYVKAIDLFSRYLELAPDDPRGSYNLAILHYRMKNYSQAAVDARKSLDLGYANAEKIMTKINLKLGPDAAPDAGVGNSVSDAWLETETVHHMRGPAAAVAAQQDTRAMAPPAAEGDMLRHTVLEDELLDLSVVSLPGGAAVDPLLNDETTLIEPTKAAVAQNPIPTVGERKEDLTAAKHLFLDGMNAYRNKDYRPALEHFGRFAALRPQEAKGHYNLAIIHYRLKDYDRAMECARRAQDLGAGSARKIVKKIEAKMAGRKAAGAPEHLQAAAEDAPEPLSFSAAENGGATGIEDTAAIWGADELEEEINQALFSQVAEESPDGGREEVILFDPKPEGAKDPVDETAADPFDPNPRKVDPDGVFQNERLKYLFELGRMAVEKKEYLKAIQHFSKVTRLAPGDPRGYYHLADVSFRLRFYETAREHATRAIELGSTAANRILSQITALQLPA